MRLNVGCGEHPLDGWTNVDMVPPADIVGDIRTLHFADVDEIRCDHMLEHVARADVAGVLLRFQQWLRPGGRVSVEVPDMAAIMAAGAADPWWEQYIYGSQSHEGEFHRSGFVAGTLTALLWAVGFREVRVEEFRSTLPWRDEMPCLKGEGARGSLEGRRRAELV